jgi:type IV pilus assembly protein PilY1
VLASLGAGDLASPTRADTRRFYNAPDVTLITPRGARPFYNLAIGSGYRGHPLDKETDDRFYSVRDYLPFSVRPQSEYSSDDWDPITDDDLQDVTADLDAVVSEGSPGWKLKLEADGEKVLVEATTVGGIILFPTFDPGGPANENPCLPATRNRAYIVQADTGRPYFQDRSVALNQAGIAAELTVLPDRKDEEPCTGDNCPPPCKEGDENCPKDPDDPGTICLSGVEKLQRCVPFGDAIRTYWQRN